MTPDSREGRAFWRVVALLFAVSVVTLRLGIAGCGPAFFGPTKAGGGFNGAQQVPPPRPVASAPAANAASPNPPAAPAPAPRLRDPAFLPPTKAGGGFYAAPEPAETAAPQRPRPQQASARPRSAPTQAVPQAPDPDQR